ncbi:metacaspase-1-like [Pyrus ussuriensis x Pyrus communis]|uniref:Metacaspase-1-like n=1 Tax=Pyrus ussuriensis x Pyrus communis TaxID=2448454 RepID=A0A5N5F0C2_9ROSA|nr:metacaspase-1-like [Pyrus ussuriensis x Pyrus communis]
MLLLVDCSSCHTPLQLPHTAAAAARRSDDPLRPVPRRHSHRRLPCSSSSPLFVLLLLLILPPRTSSIPFFLQPRAAGASAVGARAEAGRDMRRVV